VTRPTPLLLALLAALCWLAPVPAFAKGKGNGLPCTFGSDCESGNCSFKVCAAKSGSGGKQLGGGVACTFGSDCKSGDCSFGHCK
jgi:hypothetical protein